MSRYSLHNTIIPDASPASSSDTFERSSTTLEQSPEGSSEQPSLDHDGEQALDPIFSDDDITRDMVATESSVTDHALTRDTETESSVTDHALTPGIMTLASIAEVTEQSFSVLDSAGIAPLPPPPVPHASVPHASVPHAPPVPQVLCLDHDYESSFDDYSSLLECNTSDLSAESLYSTPPQTTGWDTDRNADADEPPAAQKTRTSALLRRSVLGPVAAWQDLAVRCLDARDSISKRRSLQAPTVHPFLEIGPAPPHHVRFNVAGRVFDISIANLQKFPDSLFCSPELELYYNPQLGEYFFDRNRIAFEFIVQFVQAPQDAKITQFPNTLPAELLEMELEFFGIGWRYFTGSIDPDDSLGGIKVSFETLKEKSYAFFNYPEWCTCSRVYMYFDLFFIILSIGQFIFESDPTISEQLDSYDSNTVGEIFFVITWICLIFFTFDIIARFVVSLDRVRFFLDITLWLDVISLLPFYVDVFENFADVTDSNSALQLLKIARISRCFKIVRRSETLLMILNILVECGAELALLAFVWLIGVMLSGTLLYFAESQLMIYLTSNPTANLHNTTLRYNNGTVYYEERLWFFSILESCWQAVVIIGTVGYGNNYPFYPLGKFCASAIIFVSSLLMAIPMTIIIKRFSQAYERKAVETHNRKVVGGTFDENGEHVTTIENREMTEKLRATLTEILRYRRGDSTYKDICTYFQLDKPPATLSNGS